MRAFILPIVIAALVTPAGAQSLQVFGYAGVLGEWELTATVTENVSGRTKEFSGPTDDEARRRVHAGWPGGKKR